MISFIGIPVAGMICLSESIHSKFLSSSSAYHIVDHPAAIKFLVADDHPLFRKGLSGFLAANFPNCLIKEVGDGMEVLRACREDHYDLILMDLRMPNMTGMEATRQLIKNDPMQNIIGISMHDDETHIVNMMECGA